MDSIILAIENLASFDTVFLMLTYVIAAVVGFWLVISSANKMRLMNAGNPDARGSTVLTNFIVGICLISFSIFMTFMGNSILGQGIDTNAEAIFSYAPDTAGMFEDPEFRSAIAAAVTILQLIGVWGVFRGLMLLVSYNKGTIREIGPVWVHVGAGICAAHFPYFFGMISNLF